jgi:hypothetical protein
MIVTPVSGVHDVTQEFQALIDDVTNDESRSRTAYEVERALFRRVLELGSALLLLFFTSLAAAVEMVCGSFIDPGWFIRGWFGKGAERLAQRNQVGAECGMLAGLVTQCGQDGVQGSKCRVELMVRIGWVHGMLA